MSIDSNYLSVLCLFSEEDAGWQLLLGEHLERLADQASQQVGELESLSVESYLEWYMDQDDLLRSVDVILLLLSVDFLNADYTNTYAYRSIFKWHHKKRLTVIPLLIRAVDLTDSRIKIEKIDVLPAEDKPLVSDYWIDPDNAFSSMMESLKVKLSKQLARKSEVISAWTQARNMDMLGYYDRFLEKYAHSVFSAEAKERRDELLEEKLWKTAQKNNTVEDYLTYLNDSPLRQHIQEAKNGILLIESSEEATWADAMLNDHTAFYLHYKTHFDDPIKIAAANEAIEVHLKTPIDEAAQPEDIKDISEEAEEEMAVGFPIFQTQTKYLTYQAFHQLQPDELLSLLLHLRYIRSRDGHIQNVINGLYAMNSKWQMYVYGLMIFTLMYGLFLLLYDRLWDALPVAFKVGFPSVLLLISTAIIFVVLPQIKADIQYCKDRRVLVRNETVGMKIAFLAYDEFEKRSIVQRLLDIERQLESISKKEMMDYIALK